MKLPKISIIIPVYNAEDYLERCIDSILLQTFTNYELLLINDGSQDKSGYICDCYALKDSRIRVFHKKNGGVSSARNVGLKEIKGDFFTFIDADDELVDETSLSLLYNMEFDMSVCGYEFYDVNGGRTFSTNGMNENLVLDVDSAISYMYECKYYQFYSVAKLYKSSIAKENNIFFNEDIFYSEDKLFVITYLNCCTSKILFSSTPIYKYLLRITGAMNNMNLIFNDKILTAFYATVKIYEILKKRRAHEKYVNLAGQETFSSYKKMINRMDINGIQDRKIRDYLITLLISLLGKKEFFKLNLHFYVKKIFDRVKLSLKRK